MAKDDDADMPERTRTDHPDETQSALDAIEKLIGAKLSSNAPSPPLDKSASADEKSDSEA